MERRRSETWWRLQIFGVESHQCMSGEGQRAFQWQSAFVSEWSNNDTNTSHILLSDWSNNDTNTSHTLLSDWSNNDTNTSHTLLSDWSSNLTNTSHTLLTGPTIMSMYFTDWSNNDINVFHWLLQQWQQYISHLCPTGLKRKAKSFEFKSYISESLSHNF